MQLPLWFVRVLLVTTLFCSGCGLNMERHYQKIRTKLVVHDYDAANKYIDSVKESFYKKDNRLLYYMDKSVVLQLGKHYPESNTYLELAKKTAEDLWTESVTTNVGAWLTTDNTLPYQGEDFEKVLLHFVGALNYLQMGDYAAARVEARQVTAKLELYNASYGDDKNQYKDDAFCRWLSGKLAETDRDDLQALNDAWIDYKKAIALYTNDYADKYQTRLPDFVVQDALRVLDALKSDFNDEFRDLQSRYPNVPYVKQRDLKSQGEIVLLHLAGEAPYKRDEFWTAQAGVDVIRVAFPRFVRKPHHITQVRMHIDGSRDSMSELGEDITAIAIRNLEDHMGRIKAKAIARQVSKFIAGKALQAGGSSVGKKNEAAGAAMQVAGLLWNLGSAIAEEADKRSWITLPSAVSVSRAYTRPGPVQVTLDFLDGAGNVLRQSTLTTEVKAGETTFLAYRTYE